MSPSRGWAISSRPPAGAAGGERLLKLTLLSRTYCHLCEEMLTALAALSVEHAFSVEVVDVDQNADLEERYGGMVPVLLHGDAELCHYHLDEGKVRAYLDKIR